MEIRLETTNDSRKETSIDVAEYGDRFDVNFYGDKMALWLKLTPKEALRLYDQLSVAVEQFKDDVKAEKECLHPDINPDLCSCGGEGIVRPDPYMDVWEICCRECGNQVFAASYQEALERWNKGDYEKWDDPLINGTEGEKVCDTLFELG